MGPNVISIRVGSLREKEAGLMKTHSSKKKTLQQNTIYVLQTSIFFSSQLDYDMYPLKMVLVLLNFVICPRCLSQGLASYIKRNAKLQIYSFEKEDHKD